jgi:calcineurin-like phosphoesterase family protein
MISKVLFISDTCFPAFARVTNNEERMVQETFFKMIEKIKLLQPFDMIIGFGDYVYGNNGNGINNKEFKEHYQNFKDVLEETAACPQKFIWGDKDVGCYNGILRNASGKVLSLASMYNAWEIIDWPFQVFDVNGARFIVISTNLIGNINGESDTRLQDMKSKQENFLKEILDKSDGKVFLLLHNPTTLTKNTAVRKIVDFYRKKVALIIHGHFRAEAIRKLMLLSPDYRQLYQEYETKLVPSPMGVMGTGGGLLTMDINSNGVYKTEKHNI